MAAHNTVPYIGSKISLVSNSEIRYEGVLYTINTQESTIALQSVRCFGTEGRKMPEIPPSSDVYDFIIFRGQDIKDLTVLEACNAVNDPAIVSINQRPAGGKGSAGGGKAQGKGGGGGGYQPWNKRPSADTKGGSIGMGSYWNQFGGNNRQDQGKGSGGSYGWGQQGCGRQNQPSGYGMWGQQGGGSNRPNQRGGGSCYDNNSGQGGYSNYGRGGGQAKGSDNIGKAGKNSKGRGKGSKGNKGGGEVGKGNQNGGSRGGGQGGGGRRGGGGSGGSGAVGAPVGELPPEENADVKKEFAEEFDYEASNEKFDKVQTIEGVEEQGVAVDGKLRPLSGYDKGKSFFDNISCEATERAVDAERQKVDRDKARQFDRETFGNTRRPPRPTGGRPGKGRTK